MAPATLTSTSRSVGGTAFTMRPAKPSPSASGRTYSCRTCGKWENGTAVPSRWLSLISHGNPAQVRLGLYCCAACLDAAMPRVADFEQQQNNTRR